MTTRDEALRAVCEAVQPFVDRDAPNSPGVDELVAELGKMFDEQPQIRDAFDAAIRRIVVLARIGWRPI